MKNGELQGVGSSAWFGSVVFISVYSGEFAPNGSTSSEIKNK